MNAAQLIGNYSYTGDAISVITCTVLLVLVRWALYFSVDRKFSYVKRSLHFILIAAVTNMIFSVACTQYQVAPLLLFLLRDIYHVTIMCCMYIFILYVYHLLDVDKQLGRNIAYLNRIIFCTLMILDVLSPLTGFGFRMEDGLWYDPIVSPYNIFYVYMMLIMMLMLVGYGDRINKSVRICLVATELVIIVIMTISAIGNYNTFTSFTYILPLLVVLMLLHSNPYDSQTGAMSPRSFDSYVKRAVNSNVSLDCMVLHLDMVAVKELPEGLGKQLSGFWRHYFRDAMFFQLDNGLFVLAIARTKANGDIKSKIHKLFYEVFPSQYENYRLKYKILGIYDLDFITEGSEIKDIIYYLMLKTDENSVFETDEAMHNKLKRMWKIKEQLADIDKKHDLDDDRVLVYCQPILNTHTGKYDTAEALMRMELPELSFVTPDMFIPLAEYYGHIHVLSLIMLNKVCQGINELKKEGYKISRISVNFALSELINTGFCRDVIGIIENNNINPALIGLELTESQNESDFNIIKEKIAFLKERGLTIYLDDFGTGYSNFDRILKLGMDVIKFDRSLLLFAEEENASVLLLHFAEVFKQLKYKILFEGVETEQQEELCRTSGADYLQGFRFSKPIPFEDLDKFFEKE